MQPEIRRPFGVETLRAMVDFVAGEGWAWSLIEYVGGTRIILACGTCRSSRSAVLALTDALVDVVDGPPAPEDF